VFYKAGLPTKHVARSRASSELYTATVAAAKKIVLVDPKDKQILLTSNQAAARKFVGIM
jgi:hypothetical protein